MAIGIVAKEKPDGYNLLFCTATGLVRIPQYRPVPYKLGDITPVMSYCATQSGIAVRSDSPSRRSRTSSSTRGRTPGR